MLDAGSQESMKHELKPIRSQSEEHKKLFSLINRVDVASLMMAHDKQMSGKATGIDRITKEEYGENLIPNLKDLIGRMKAFKYIPQPVRRVYIPKANGKLRPLGIPAYEDRLVQSVMADILNEVYEPRFLDCSYGFRPNRSAHDVVRFINEKVMHGNFKWVVEADIKGFFDNVNHKTLMMFLANDISDPNFLRYVARFLKAGVMDGTELLDSDKGTPQGGLISPVLANVYLHYVLDLWVEKRVKKHVSGSVAYVRYADDFLFLVKDERDAHRILRSMIKRLERFGLEVAAEKTRILPFDRRCGTKETFDFLGFTFFIARAKTETFNRLGVRTNTKKLKAKREAVKQWLRERVNKPPHETLQTLNRKLQGHYNYYGVNGNFKFIAKFYRYAKYRTYWMLRRRSQRSKLTWEKFVQWWEMTIKPPRICVQIWGYKVDTKLV